MPAPPTSASPTPEGRSERTAADTPEHLVLFDGDCGLCQGTVAWLIARDPDARLRFAPLQGETAQALARRWPDMPRDLSTILYLERTGEGERLHQKSRALFRLCPLLAGPARHLALFRFLPTPIADFGYGLVARTRHRCADPVERATGDHAERFLP